MSEIEIVYSKGCPNLEGARDAVSAALSTLGMAIEWREWDCAAPDTPRHLRGYGSPTILVDGRDVVQTSSAAGDTCRLYDDGAGSLSGVPSVARIVDALDRSQEGGSGKENGGR